MERDKRSSKDRLRTNILWIISLFAAWYMFIASIAEFIIGSVTLYFLPSLSGGMRFIMEYYSFTIVSIIVLFIFCQVFAKNRYIWSSFLPARRKKALHEPLSEDEFSVRFYGRDNNTLRMLLAGLLLGFLTNFFCILCALIHGDIKLYFEASWAQLPTFAFALVCVFIQSTSEELWCRGMLYERLNERYPLWISIAVNGLLFGLLHTRNPSVTVLSITGIVVGGFSYSLLRWYAGSIWIAMGIHTGWNFTQNFLFGLPNSGLVSEFSLFHLGAANGTTNLIYDYGFGVEGALPALFMDALVGIICLILAKRDGRLGELLVSKNTAYKEYKASFAEESDSDGGASYEQDYY